MKKIFKASQTKNIDVCTIQEERIISVQLMERASTAMSEYLIRELDKESRVVVFGGSGNNGGDAFVLARILVNVGYEVDVYFVGNKNKITDECRANLSMVDNFVTVDCLESSLETPVLNAKDQIIDGILGSGINRPVTGFLKELIQAINRSGAKVYSIDVPSGLFGEDNETNDFEAVVRSDIVFSMQYPKLSLLLPQKIPVCSKIQIVDIGLSESCMDTLDTDYQYIETEDIQALIHPRDAFAHKGTFGHALLIAGSYGKMGAAILAAKACLRAGVGLLTVHLPMCGLDIMQSVLPEAMVSADSENRYITNLSAGNLSKYTIGIGPGIGQMSKTKELLIWLFTNTDKPMVIDADALNMIALDDNLRNKIPQNSILTPHPVEFDRLAGAKSKNSYERLQRARIYAAQNKVYIVLKGAYTAIITPQEKVFFNSTGNPGMATGGSGDTLTGIITSLLTQKYTPLDAALVGTFIHGYAGDLASKQISEQSLLPTDLINHIGKAYLRLKK